MSLGHYYDDNLPEIYSKTVNFEENNLIKGFKIELEGDGLVVFLNLKQATHTNNSILDAKALSDALVTEKFAETLGEKLSDKIEVGTIHTSKDDGGVFKFTAQVNETDTQKLAKIVVESLKESEIIYHNEEIIAQRELGLSVRGR